MSLKLKVCADCGKQKMIGKSKSRCKACRQADPDKFLNRPPGARKRDPKIRCFWQKIRDELISKKPPGDS